MNVSKIFEIIKRTDLIDPSNHKTCIKMSEKWCLASNIPIRFTNNYIIYLISLISHNLHILNKLG